MRRRAGNRGYQTGILRPDGTLASYTAVTSPVVYRGDKLPADLYGNVFVAEPAANLVSRIIVSDDGTRLRARRAYERAEFLASTDERFRPVYLSNAPDDAYVVDVSRDHSAPRYIPIPSYRFCPQLDARLATPDLPHRPRHDPRERKPGCRKRRRHGASSGRPLKAGGEIQHNGSSWSAPIGRSCLH